MKEILTEEQNNIQQNSCSMETFFFQFTFYNFQNLFEYNISYFIVLYWISLIQWFSIIFNIYNIFVEFINLTWKSLPSAATRREHYSKSNVAITKNAIPHYRTQFLLKSTHEKHRVMVIKVIRNTKKEVPSSLITIGVWQFGERYKRLNKN